MTVIRHAMIANGVVVNLAAVEPDTEQGQSWLAAMNAHPDYDVMVPLEDEGDVAVGDRWVKRSKRFRRPRG